VADGPPKQGVTDFTRARFDDTTAKLNTRPQCVLSYATPAEPSVTSSLQPPRDTGSSAGYARH
jgi:hypothetical protein